MRGALCVNRWLRVVGLVALLSTAPGCASVMDTVRLGKARIAAGDLPGGNAAFQEALRRARVEVEHEHFLHLQQPVWLTFADTCVAVGEALDEAGSFEGAVEIYGNCLGYAAGAGSTGYFSALVASRVEASWARVARRRRQVAAALSHAIFAEAMRSAITRKDSRLVTEHRALAASSATAMFLSMNAGHEGWAIEQVHANGLPAPEGPGPEDRWAETTTYNPRGAAADARWAMLFWAGQGQVSEPRVSYASLLGTIPQLDRAVGVRIALREYPAMAEQPAVRALLTSAAAVEAAARGELGPDESAQIAAIFEQDLVRFRALLVQLPSGG